MSNSTSSVLDWLPEARSPTPLTRPRQATRTPTVHTAVTRTSSLLWEAEALTVSFTTLRRTAVLCNLPNSFSSAQQQCSLRSSSATAITQRRRHRNDLLLSTVVVRASLHRSSKLHAHKASQSLGSCRGDICIVFSSHPRTLYVITALIVVLCAPEGKNAVN